MLSVPDDFLGQFCCSLQLCAPVPPDHKVHIELRGERVAVQTVMSDVNESYGSDMHRAAAFNHVDELRHLQVIEGREVDAVDIKERTPLMLACKYGALDAVQELVWSGASVHAQSASGETPLDFAEDAMQWRICAWLHDQFDFGRTPSRRQRNVVWGARRGLPTTPPQSEQ